MDRAKIALAAVAVLVLLAAVFVAYRAVKEPGQPEDPALLAPSMKVQGVVAFVDEGGRPLRDDVHYRVEGPDASAGPANATLGAVLNLSRGVLYEGRLPKVLQVYTGATYNVAIDGKRSVSNIYPHAEEAVWNRSGTKVIEVERAKRLRKVAALGGANARVQGDVVEINASGGSADFSLLVAVEGPGILCRPEVIAETEDNTTVVLGIIDERGVFPVAGRRAEFNTAYTASGDLEEPGFIRLTFLLQNLTRTDFRAIVRDCRNMERAEQEVGIN